MKLFKTLRWQLVAAFGLVIFLTVLLSGALSIWATTSRFDIFITDQGRQQAAEIAPLLEASYALNGDWQGIETLFSDNTAISEAFPNPEDSFFFDEVAWISDVDWFVVVADELGLNEDDLLEQWGVLGSLTAVSQTHNTNPEQLIETIMVAEELAAETAVANGELSPEESESYLQIIEESVNGFVLETDQFTQGLIAGSDWDLIIANELELTLEQLYNLWDNQPITKIAQSRNVSTEQLVGAILRDERRFITTDTQLNETDKLLYLADILVQARDYIDLENGAGEPFDLDVAGGLSFLTSSVFGDARVLVADNGGTIIYDTAQERLDEDLNPDMLSQGVALWNFAQTEPVGTVIVATGTGFYDAQQTAFLEGVTLSMVVSGLLAGIGALLAGWLVSRRITAPVTALTTAAHHIASGNWDGRVQISSQDELGQMSQAFNKMAASLENQHQLRKRLVDDVSHELQTPLSVIQLELEAMQDGLQSPDQAAVQVKQEIAVLKNLVNDLSLLAEFDEGGIQLVRESVALPELLHQIVSRWQSKATAAGTTLEISASSNLPMIQADPARLAQVLGNLLSNGIRHAPNGRIQIQCRKEERNGRSWLVTSIQDNGEGIPAEDLPHIFDRFYRADGSRNRHSGGRGLGLAIVKQIVELHGGWVTATSTKLNTSAAHPGAGSTFEYGLPV